MKLVVHVQPVFHKPPWPEARISTVLGKAQRRGHSLDQSRLPFLKEGLVRLIPVSRVFEIPLDISNDDGPELSVNRRSDRTVGRRFVV